MSDRQETDFAWLELTELCGSGTTDGRTAPTVWLVGRIWSDRGHPMLVTGVNVEFVGRWVLRRNVELEPVKLESPTIAPCAFLDFRLTTESLCPHGARQGPELMVKVTANLRFEGQLLRTKPADAKGEIERSEPVAPDDPDDAPG